MPLSGGPSLILASCPISWQGGPLNGIHALGFFAALVEAPRLVKSSLGRSHILGGGSTCTFRLLSRRGPAADLALHVLGRSGASPPASSSSVKNLKAIEWAG